jgi:hypothetical protein
MAVQDRIVDDASHDERLLFHLALRCASTSTGTTVEDVQLIQSRSKSAAMLRDCVSAVEEHLYAHPDDEQLRRARDLLVIASRGSGLEVVFREVRREPFNVAAI